MLHLWALIYLRISNRVCLCDPLSSFDTAAVDQHPDFPLLAHTFAHKARAPPLGGLSKLACFGGSVSRTTDQKGAIVRSLGCSVRLGVIS